MKPGFEMGPWEIRLVDVVSTPCFQPSINGDDNDYYNYRGKIMMLMITIIYMNYELVPIKRFTHTVLLLSN